MTVPFIVALSKWTWLWLGWLAAFAVIEITATLSKHRHPRTLTEHVLRWFPKPKWRWVVVALMAFLAWHFASGPEYVPPPYVDSCP